MIPLNQLRKGQKAVIEAIETERLPLKLIEMGCLPGNEIQLLQTAPYNDPLYLKIDHSHLAIRLESAGHIYVGLI